MNNNLPESISAWEYEEKCGRHHAGYGIAMVDDQGEIICRLTGGTTREKKIAMLWQAAPALLRWAKEACETARDFYDERDTDITVPSWLPELEAAVKAAEAGEFSTDKL